MLTHIEGLPVKGMRVSVSGRDLRIVDIGTNSTDGKPVSARACLTGRPVPPYGAVFVDWQPPNPEGPVLHGLWVEEVSDQ